MIYLIGSLRNNAVPEIASALRGAGHEVFDDWYAAGPEADDKWRDYERGRERGYLEALQGYAARHVFEFDLTHLRRADAAVLVLPAGKSGHLELGWILGQGKPGYILLDNPDRWDVMYQFATGIFDSKESLIADLSRSAMEGPGLRKGSRELDRISRPYDDRALVGSSRRFFDGDDS